MCGISISASEAIFALVDIVDGEAIHENISTKRCRLVNDKQSENVRSFSKTISTLAHENRIDFFSIKSRQAKGQMAAGGITFKIEGLIQLQEHAEVMFVSPQAISVMAKKNKAGIPSSVNRYQEDAFLAAIVLLDKLGDY